MFEYGCVHASPYICLMCQQYLRLKEEEVYSVQDSIDGVSEVVVKLRLVSDSFTLPVDKGIIEDLLKELAHVEAMLRRLKREGVK